MRVSKTSLAYSGSEPSKGPSGSKYRSKKTTVGDLVFDSAKEAKRWGELQLLVKAGEIRDLQRQVRFPLIVNGVKVASLVADFAYYFQTPLGEHDAYVVEDTKSDFTRKLPMWRLKSKMFAAQYGFPVREV